MPLPEPPPVPLSAAAQQALDSYVSKLVADAHLPFVKALAAWGEPVTRARASSQATAVAGLVMWAEQTGRPVEPEVLLDPDVVEEYLGSLKDQGFSVQYVKGNRNIYKRMRRARAGQRLNDRHEATGDHGDAPYTPAEIDALLLWARHHPLPVRSQVTLAVLVLGLGAGLSNLDLRHVRGTDVRRDPGTGAVLIHVGGPRTRTVPLLSRYETEALRLAAEAGDGWILNPGLDPAAGTRPEAVVNAQIKAAKPPTSAPKLKVTRCRTTWLCHHLAAGTRVDVLAAAGGYADAPAATEAARYLQPPPAEDAIASLRNAGPQQPHAPG